MDEDMPMSLVVPFTVCQSKGGPYEDQSFVAGFQAGELWARLTAFQAMGGVRTEPQNVYTELLPQVDLIAMHFGYRVLVDLSEVPEWRVVTFVKGS